MILELLQGVPSGPLAGTCRLLILLPLFAAALGVLVGALRSSGERFDGGDPWA